MDGEEGCKGVCPEEVALWCDMLSVCPGMEVSSQHTKEGGWEQEEREEAEEGEEEEEEIYIQIACLVTQNPRKIPELPCREG